MDVVVEAVFDSLALKQQVFRELDGLCRPGTIPLLRTPPSLRSMKSPAQRHDPNLLSVLISFTPPM